MRTRSIVMLGTALFWALACGSGEDEAVDEGTEEGEEEEEDVGEAEEGKTHLDFPAVGLDAVEGQFILAPSEDSVNKAIENDGGTLIYYGGNVVEVGDITSKIKSEAGTESTVPNSVIVPIKAGQKAQPGDILLGHWESGSGMQRAIVLAGGTPAAPHVRYLDMDNKEDDWEADRFQAIRKPFDLGTTMACGEGDDRDHSTLVAIKGDRVLVSGFASKLLAFDKSECVSLIPNDTFAKGDAVWIPKVGRYNAGKVTKIEKANGQVWVEYEWGGKTSTEAFPIIDVTKSFDQADGGKGGKGKAGKGKSGKTKPTPKPKPKKGKGGGGMRKPGN